MKSALILTLMGLLVLNDLRVNATESGPLLIEKITLLEVDATINPATANYLKTEIDKAAQSPQTMIVLQLNTPGGLVSTTKSILTLLGHSPVPVVVWVTPAGASATSAGAIIASGAHGLVMDRGTNIGAATPVELSADIKEQDVRAKAINDLTSLVRSLAHTRGRNPLAFEKMISEGRSYTLEEAQKEGVVDGAATSLEEIRTLFQNREVLLRGQKRQLQFATALQTQSRPMDLGQRLLNVLAHPTTAYILFILGAALLYFEFQAPGGYIAGASGVLCLILAAIAFQVLPLNFGAVVLLIVGLILFILELYLTSYGLLALAGLACVFAGSLFLYRHEDGWISVSYTVIYSTLGGIGCFLAIITWLLSKDRHEKRAFFSHTDEVAEILKELHAAPGDWEYQVKIHGEIWKAKAQEAYQVGDRVRVRKQNNQNLFLEIIKD